jgi:hypothetical protein
LAGPCGQLTQGLILRFQGASTEAIQKQYCLNDRNLAHCVNGAILSEIFWHQAMAGKTELALALKKKAGHKKND